MNLSYMPKFHMLYEHVPDILLEMNDFFDMGEDPIECWHQIHMWHYARIRTLRSEHHQKACQARYKYTNSNMDIKNTITMVNEKLRRNFKDNHVSVKTRNSSRKKTERETRRN